MVIQVNVGAPARYGPARAEGRPDAGSVQKLGEDSAFVRPGPSAELTPVYVLLASDEAINITGEVYGVTGGGSGQGGEARRLNINAIRLEYTF